MAAPVIQLIEKAADKYQVPREYAKAIAKIESNFDPNAVSNKGAIGVFQLRPGTAKPYGVTNLYDPAQNVDAGVRHFSELLAKNDNNVDRALAAYNAGQGAVNKYGGVPPYSETQNYIKKFNDMVNPNDPQNQQAMANSPMLNANASTLDILKALGQPQGQGAMSFDPNSFVRPVDDSPILDNFNRAMAALATVGGTTADIVGGVRGTGSHGGQSTQAGLNLLQQLQKDQQQKQNQRILNDLYQNQNIPPNVRASIGLSATGLPADVVKQVTGGNQADLLKDAIDIKSGLQRIDANSPEGISAKLQRDAELDQIKRNAQLDAQKTLLEYKAGLKQNDPIKESEAAMKLRKEFNAIPQVKDYNNLSAANERMNSVYEAYKKSPQDFQSRSFLDQSLIIGFNKVLDPASVVRESEYARTPEGLALINRIQGAAQKLQSGGGGLTDQDRGELVKAMNLLQKGQEKEYKTWLNFYKDEALRSNISPERIIKGLKETESTLSPTDSNSVAKPSEFKKEDYRKMFNY